MQALLIFDVHKKTCSDGDRDRLRDEIEKAARGLGWEKLEKLHTAFKKPIPASRTALEVGNEFWGAISKGFERSKVGLTEANVNLALLLGHDDVLVMPP